MALGSLCHLLLPLPHVVSDAEFADVSPTATVAVWEVILGQIAANEYRVQSRASSNGLAIALWLIGLGLDGLG